MTVLDLNKGISYPYLSPCQVAQLIGVDRSTVYRWRKLGGIERYNRYVIVFAEIRINGKIKHSITDNSAFTVLQK